MNSVSPAVDISKFEERGFWGEEGIWVERDKERHYTMTKGSIHEEDITIVNIYAPNTGTLQYIRQMLISIKGEIGSNTTIVGNFNTQIIPTQADHPGRKLISKPSLK